MMRGSWLLLCAVTHAVVVGTVNANVEKVIFLGSSPIALSAIPNAPPSLDTLRLDSLSPSQSSSIVATQLPVLFPTTPVPRGEESWYLLKGLEQGRRYEVRICWPATQPTDFWLDTYSIAHVFDTPDLISSLARYSEKRKEAKLTDGAFLSEHPPPQVQSTLFLRVQAAASYYSNNQTLMEYPPAVHVDIILDPYILNIIPRSLAPTAAYIVFVAIGAWFISGFIYRWLLTIAANPPPKPHVD
ncbi:hypothetical protein K504DRAFT_238935 [Pleomassaria siparia CBS 279.74]|uniref:Protein PBN1 n=1 Tax=Pleomassaria siparia CBS 279.74 TaxID=1314801 RepID=A0A6G1KDS7_9PLEO|nr:hypothetical protein K504DRAFT_238935 [Pleomassaria siparia CBS 279.74]